jgi:DNA polymerase-3 subunit beta
VCITSDKNIIIFVATDSFRLSEKKETTSKQVDFPTIIVPCKNMLEIVRIFDQTTDDITLTINDNQISFSTPAVYVTSRVVSGVFPDYKQILPKNFSTEVVVLKQDLLNTLKSANIFSDKFNQVTFSVFPNKKKFECVSKNSDVGEYSGDLQATLKGDDVSLSLNHRYLIDCLSIIPQDSIWMGLNGGNKAIVIRGVSDNSFTYLLQPMNK